MGDHQKKGQKQKPEAKEQRKPRQSKKQHVEIQYKNVKIVDKSSTDVHSTKGSAKPVYEEPPPEFYKNLKRETDEILKITEEADSKYKKKEILSNWAKYEMPIESYDDIEEQDMGADFEQLIQASMSVGSHFQFKHEKSWDQSTAPSLYDKYFDINSSNLATALYTIPFYERNCIDKTMFTQTDIQNMDGRTSRHKQKYFNDKSFAPEAESLENIQRLLKEGITLHDSANTIENNENTMESEFLHEDMLKKVNEGKDKEINTHSKASEELQPSSPLATILKSPEKHVDDIDDIIFGKVSPVAQLTSTKIVDLHNIKHPHESEEKTAHLDSEDQETQSGTITKPVTESSEDLEKWLDDFLA